MRTLSLVSALALAATGFAQSPELSDPIKITAGGAAIDGEVGHTHPLFVDLDGDGLRDLLVGQFGGGKLRIYKNVGQKSSPKFDECTWFEADHKLGTIPAS